VCFKVVVVVIIRYSTIADGDAAQTGTTSTTTDAGAAV
jgi:hypothetical protein